MRKTCVPVATENMEEINIHGIVYIKKDYCIQWACVKLAIYRIIIRGKIKDK